MSNRDEIIEARRFIGLRDDDAGSWRETESYEIAELMVRYAKTENARLCLLLVDIRAALGDPEGKMMQEDFVKHCKRLGEWVNDLTVAHSGESVLLSYLSGGVLVYEKPDTLEDLTTYPTPLEALTAYLKGKE